jgi:hypothetical protein
MQAAPIQQFKTRLRAGFWVRGKTRLQPRVALYVRLSSLDQQTLPPQIKTMREVAVRRGWQISTEIKEISSGALQRAKREELLAASSCRELDATLSWRLDRWGCPPPDLVATLEGTGGTEDPLRFAH